MTASRASPRSILRCCAAPTHRTIRNSDPVSGQLMQEGAMQVFYPAGIGSAREPILAVVGRLQFDVIQHRLLTEYNVETTLEMMDMKYARWIEGIDGDAARVSLTIGSRLVEDSDGRPAVLCDTDWSLSRVAEKNPDLKFLEIAPATPHK